MVSIGPMKLRRRHRHRRHSPRLLLVGRKPAAPTGVGAVVIGGRDHEETSTTTAEAPSIELLRVLQGEMTEEEYLVGCVEKALSHVKGRISAGRLEAIRQTLLLKLETDPVLLHTRARVFRRRDRDGN